MEQKDEPLVLSCPYSIQGCTYSTQSEEEMKTHLRECQYFMNEYIKEFLQKKKQELEKENKTEQAQLIEQAIHKVQSNTYDTSFVIRNINNRIQTEPSQSPK